VLASPRFEVSMSAPEVRRNPKVEEAPLQGELMLFDPATSRFFVLNRTMAYVWRSCEGAIYWDGLVEGLAAEFSGVEPHAAEAHLRQAVDELMKLGLVFDAGSPTA
jgi:coenzyme PQQ synthesis protein D (PqqD)